MLYIYLVITTIYCVFRFKWRCRDKYDGHTLSETLQQTKRLIGKMPKVAICDRGFRGKSDVDGVEMLIPKPPGKRTTPYQKQKARKRFRRRAGIEPIIGHLKSDYRLFRNYLKGNRGDSINFWFILQSFEAKKCCCFLWIILIFIISYL